MIGAACVAAVLLIGGSWWPGWQLDSTAMASVQDGKKDALVKVLAPVCANRFKSQPNFDVQMAAFKEVKSWERDQYLVDNNWVVSSDLSSDVKMAVGDACAELLADITK
jgi:hypothetical protein